MDYDDAGNIITRGIYRRNGITEILDIEYRYDYDDLGRLICISTPYMYGGEIHLLEYYYDNADLIRNIADEYGIPVEAYSNLENTNGKLVAEVACNRPFGMRFYTGKTSYVVDVYSYFPEGHIKTKYKVIPGLPLQTIKYEYDVHGKNSAEEFTAATIVSKKYYKYDEYGNLKAIAHGTPSNDVLTYDYDPQGKLKSKDLSLLSGSKTVSYSYNIRDWFESSSFNGVNRFSQILDYIDNGTTTSFSGNVQVSQVSYENQLGDTKVYKQRYTYDGVNRLTAIDSKDLADNPQFTGAYTYDNAGRFNSKQERSSNNDAYEYYKDSQRATNRLKKAKTTGDGLYIFDSRGNLIIDKEKKMHIAYDWRNMPIKFSFFNDLPVGEKTSTEKIRPDDYGTITINDSRYINREPTCYVDWLCEKGEITLQSSVQILYDASGKRVLKIAK